MCATITKKAVDNSKYFAVDIGKNLECNNLLLSQIENRNVIILSGLTLANKSDHLMRLSQMFCYCGI